MKHYSLKSILVIAAFFIGVSINDFKVAILFRRNAYSFTNL